MFESCLFKKKSKAVCEEKLEVVHCPEKFELLEAKA